MARNPYTKPTRRTNRDIYEEELKKLEKLQERAAKYGIQDSYKRSKAKRITQKQIKGIKARSISLKSEIKKAKTRERNERRRQQRHEEGVERRQQRKAQTVEKKALEKKAKEAEKKHISAQRKRARMDRANARAREKRAQAKLLKELQEKFPSTEQPIYDAFNDILKAEQDKIATQQQIAEQLSKSLPSSIDFFPWNQLIEQRYSKVRYDINRAIEYAEKSKFIFDITPLYALRDTITDWYFEAQHGDETAPTVFNHMLDYGFFDWMYDWAVIYDETIRSRMASDLNRLIAEHNRYSTIAETQIEEKFGVLEDEI